MKLVCNIGIFKVKSEDKYVICGTYFLCVKKKQCLLYLLRTKWLVIKTARVYQNSKIVTLDLEIINKAIYT